MHHSRGDVANCSEANDMSLLDVSSALTYADMYVKAA